ncbi:MAG: hypothetical protein KJP19_01090 [Deltaproteobacteria bacterium]|nr:hypothetical protein [Deltaproteobacteria bacterium]
MSDIRSRLQIPTERLEEINRYLLDPENPLITRLLELIEKYGGVDEINRKALEAGDLSNLMKRLKEQRSPYGADLDWLLEQRQNRAFISMPDYRRKILGGKADKMTFNTDNAVTLEISALQFFPWLITQAKHSIKHGELMPGRYIRVRAMKEQEADDGDILAVAAAMRIIGASYVETLDTKGTDGSNVHLGGPETITGYFGGIGQPNDYPLKWIDEYLYYFTTYGIRQVLNINPGTVLLGYLLHKLGVDMEFKISVFMGNDNPYAVLWTLIGSRMFGRDDGSSSLIGFNFSNSVNNQTIIESDTIRRALNQTERVRFEHHITEPIKHIVRQPYLRRDELVEVAATVPNISAKHEGGDPEVDQTRVHVSDILEYFLPKEEILAQGLMEALEQNYMDKHDAINRTAEALTRAGIDVICAENLHR